MFVKSVFLLIFDIFCAISEAIFTNFNLNLLFLMLMNRRPEL